MQGTVNRAQASAARAWNGLLLGQGLALLFLVGCFGRVFSELAHIVPSHRVTGGLTLDWIFGTPLAWQLGAFLAGVLFCHSLLGLAAFGLARLTEAAFPRVVITRREWLVTGWMAVLVGLILAANATWHSSSMFAGESGWWSRTIAGVLPVQPAAGVIAAMVLWLVVRAHKTIRLQRGTAIAAGIALLAIAVLPASLDASVDHAGSDKPHIVIIGIDSLRNDLHIPRKDDAFVPHVREFLAGAHHFTDATSPLARTFPAWMSILTGRHTVTTNARFNLMPKHALRATDTLAHALRRDGYRTIFATDEVRFANFDKSYGFDQLLTPPIGAQDFLLGFGGDLPLVNLVASTKVGGRLFPSNHANRAAFVTYEPEQFVERLDEELDVTGPSFIAIHLTLAHWPYAWAGMTIPTDPPAYREAYGIAVAEVDRQFYRVMSILADKGVLENAIVVLLSDHGEALGDEHDSMFRSSGSGREIWDSLWGHGTSVMSPHQYGVLLAFRTFGQARLPGAPGRYDWPVSLEDVRPTLEELATGRRPADVDGISLAPLMADPGAVAGIAGRIRYTETGFNTPSTLVGRYGASGLMDEAGTYYELNRDTAWVQMRVERVAELLAKKQRAAFTSNRFLAAIPDPRGARPKYLLSERRNPAPVRLPSPPAGLADPETERLWQALQARFPGELAPGHGLP